MNRSQRHPALHYRFRMVAPALTALLLAACSSDGDYFPQRDGYIDAPQRNAVEVVERDHRIDLSPGQSSLTSVQIDSLNAFLASHGRDYGDHIEIYTTLASGLGQGRTRNAMIVDELRSAFIRGGYLSTRIHLINQADSSDSLRVAIQRYSVVLPDCSIEAEKAESGWTNEPVAMRPLGCANERNLGLMVADPRDLAGHRNLGHASGVRESEAIIRYNTDSVKDLLLTGTGSGAAGEGQGGGGD